MVRGFCNGWVFLCVLSACQPVLHDTPSPLPPIPDSPRAAPGPVVESQHGVDVADPFRWLEEKGATRADWVSGQAEAGRRWLDKLPQRGRVAGVLEAFRSMAGLQLLQQYGSHVYFFYDPGGGSQSDLYRMGADAFHRWSCPAGTRCDRLPSGAERVLPASDWPADRVLLSVSVSPDGRRVAWREQAGETGPRQWFWKSAGSPTETVRGGDAGPVEDLLWTRDSRGWYVIRSGAEGDRLERIPVGGSPGGSVVCPLEPGTVIEQLHRVADQSGGLILRVGSSGGEQRLLICNGEGQPPRRLDEGLLVDPGYLGSRAGWHYFLHRRSDWRGEVIALTLSEDGRTMKRSVVSPAEQRLVGAALASASRESALWLHYRDGGESVLRFHDGKPESEAGTVTWSGMPDAMRIEGMVHAGDGAQGGLYLTSSDPASPRDIVRLREGGALAETVWSADPPAATESFVVRRHDVDTGAGRMVPVYVAGNRNILDNGSPARVVLEAYGGFDEPVDLHFSPSRAAWMALGGVYAVAGVRGGGDFDQDWYLAGRGAGKLDSIRDLEAVMAWLVEEGITAPRRLALRGYSQGATLASAVAVRDRQPVHALLVSAGVMDMLRYPLYGAGSTWLAEYGDPRGADGFDVLWQYSPYHRLLEQEARGGRHPFTLVMTRDEDPVVFPLHSYKYLAALRKAGVPAVLRLEQGASHAGTAPVDVLHQRHTDQWALLLAVLGQ